MEKLFNITKYFLSLLTLAGLVLAPFVANADNKTLNISDPNTIVCEALNLVGIGCGTSQATPYVPYARSTSSPQATSSPVLMGNTGNTNDNSSLTAAIYNSGSKGKRGDVVLVRVIGQTKIYEIIGGKKHFIPTKDIFYDYGFRDELIQNITAEELNRYPRVKLIRVAGDNKKTYYLTEGQMLRLIPGKKVSDSYGDREEDVIVISKKEFNFYPQNQFVFLERPLRRDVFQIVNGKKRYLTPMAVERMKIRDTDVAPVNETEFSYHKTGSPVIF